MTRQRILIGLIICLVVVVFAETLFCRQTGFRRAQASGENFGASRQNMRRGANFENFMANMKEREAQMMKQALGADERQWKIIEPKLEKVRTYRDQAIGSIGTSSFGGSFITFPMMPDSNQPGAGFQASQGASGGFGFGGGSFSMSNQNSQGLAAPQMNSFSSGNMLSREPTEVERIAGELQILLQNINVKPGEITQKLNSLRKTREKAKKQWLQAQKELQEALNIRQQAVLVMMGLLE